MGGVVTAVDVSDSPRLRELPDSPAPDFASTLGERMLAGTISDYHGPLFRGDDKYNGTGDESAQAVARAHVYRILSGRSYHDLQLHLERCDYVRDTLGLVNVPHRTTFAHSWREQFSEETKEYIEEWAGWIQEALDRLDVAEVEPYLPPEEPDETEPLPEIAEGHINTAIEHVRDIMTGTTGFKRGPNTTYDDGEILDVALNACRERGEMATVIDQHEPWLKTVMNAVKKRSGREWNESFQSINERVLNAAKGAGMLDRPVEAYLDITIIPFYPQKSERPAMARGNANKNGTMHGFHFATVVARDKDSGKDMVVASTPYTPEMGPYDLLVELVDQAEEHCSLEALFIDSEFATVRIVDHLEEKGIDYITRLKRRGERIQGALASMSGRYDDWTGYMLKSSTHNMSKKVRLVTEPDWDNATEEVLQREIENNQSTLDDYDQGDTRAIPDIEDVPKEMWQCRRPHATSITDQDVETLMKRYKLRWRVENAYADKKRALLGKTQSRDHGVRVFLFWLTAVLYNGWMLARIFLRMDHPNHRPQDRPPVTARDFMKKILSVGYG